MSLVLLKNLGTKLLLIGQAIAEIPPAMVQPSWVSASHTSMGEVVVVVVVVENRD